MTHEELNELEELIGNIMSDDELIRAQELIDSIRSSDSVELDKIPAIRRCDTTNAPLAKHVLREGAITNVHLMGKSQQNDFSTEGPIEQTAHISLKLKSGFPINDR